MKRRSAPSARPRPRRPQRPPNAAPPSLEWRAPADLQPYPQNPRENDAAVSAVAASIQAFGFRQPIVVDGAGVILAGHTRWKAAQALGLARVPVHVATDLTPEQARAYRIADNKSHDLATWNPELLGQELAALEAIDWTTFGFGKKELVQFLADRTPKPGLTDPDDVPAARRTRIKPGQLFALGTHRLFCGDSENADDLARVIGGDPVDTCISDPPYGINHDLDYRRFTGGKNQTRNTTPGTLRNDDRPFDPAPWLSFASVVLWGANCFSSRLPMGTWLVWDKRFASGVAFLADAEAAWMKGGHGVYIYSLTSQGFVRPEPVEHPTQKPVALMAWCIEKAKGGRTVLDPYVGSGTTIIACEQLGRRCVAIEIEPAFCQVAIDRWEAFTGQKATRV